MDGGALAIDTCRFPWHDVTRRVVRQEIVRWIRCHKVCGVMTAFPCTSWSRARWPPLRTTLQLAGVDGLNEKEQKQVADGDATLRFATAVVRACLAADVPCICENPAAGMAWLEPSMQKLRVRASSDTTCDLCQFSAPWRKRTRLVAWCCGAPPAQFTALCQGRHGLCSRTDKPHLVLRGKCPSTGQDRTKIAQAYPVTFARAIAKWFCDGRERLRLSRLNFASSGPVHRTGMGQESRL